MYDPTALLCSATDYDSTDWKQIRSLYDQLVWLDDSPTVALNRAVAPDEVYSPQAGIQEVEAINCQVEFVLLALQID